MSASNSSRLMRLLQGPGWRLGYHPDQEYVGLVGSDLWALELTEQEWQDFCQALPALQQVWQQLQSQVMDEESLSIDHNTNHLQLVISGSEKQFQIYLKLLTGRRGEGIWAGSVISEVIQAMQKLYHSLP